MIGSPTKCAGCGYPMTSCVLPSYCFRCQRKRYTLKVKKLIDAVLEESADKPTVVELPHDSKSEGP